MTMSKFETKNAGSRLGIRVLGAPKNAVLKLLNSTTQRKGPVITTTHYDEMRDAVLRAEYNKSLGLRYLAARKLTIL